MKTKVKDLNEVDRLRAAQSCHGADVELRRRGYRIRARPKNGPALWEKDGMVFIQVQSGSIQLERKRD